MEILDLAEKQNFRFVDTAPTYPDSEMLVGKFLARKNSKLQVYTKFGRGSITNLASSLPNSLEKSLKHLKVDRIYGLSVHNVDLNSLDYSLFEQISNLKKEGIITRFGWPEIGSDYLSQI